VANEIVITVNGQAHLVEASPDTPLLYVLRNELGLNGPQFGCGLEQCGACMVLLGVKAAQSCKLPVSEVRGAAITTLEGLAAGAELHPIQRAFLEEQAAQCGFCTNGMIISAAALLAKNRHPTDPQIREALDVNLCRCGAHVRILRAVKRAAQLLSEEWGETNG
jgi:nicotinate dehydrogenase subunit A